MVVDAAEEMAIEDIEQQKDIEEQIIQETLFTFEAFEAVRMTVKSFILVELNFVQKFANEEITHTLMTYLARFREFASSEQMKRVVNLLHRQAVKAKAEGLFFKVSIF